MARKPAPAAPDPLEEPVPGVAGQLDLDEAVVVSATGRGEQRRAALLPRSLKGMTREQEHVVGHLQDAAFRLRDLQEEVNVVVDLCRESGVSWSAIGWSLGITAQAAHERFRKRIEP